MDDPQGPSGEAEESPKPSLDTSGTSAMSVENWDDLDPVVDSLRGIAEQWAEKGINILICIGCYNPITRATLARFVSEGDYYANKGLALAFTEPD